MTTISAIIPAFNEADRITDTIAALRTIRGIDEIIVVDDGSTDDTAARADAAGADAVIRKANGGKGSALTAGAHISSSDILILVDADLGSTASQMEALLHPVKFGTADMTIATFPTIPGKGGGSGFVVKLARWGINKLTGRSMGAPLSGQRVITRRLLTEVCGFASGWGVEVSLTVKALWLDFVVMEVPTTMTHRVTGKSTSDRLHRVSQFIAAAKTLFALWRTRPSDTEAKTKPKTNADRK